MKHCAVIPGLVLAGLLSGCYEKSGGPPEAQFGALLRWQFVGTAQLASSSDAAKLRQIAAVPSTAEFRDEVLQKLARAPQAFWAASLPAGVADQSALIRPLLDDLLTAESFLEVRGPIERSETVLAIQLSDSRAGLWQTNLWRLVQNWKLGTPQAWSVEGFKGWELKRQDAPGLVRCLRARNWLLVSLGADRLPLLPTLAQQVSKAGRPVPGLQSAWLDLAGDWPALRKWFPVCAEFRLPPTRLTVVGKGENLRTEARMYYSEKVPWTPAPWKIPTNAIKDPIISFTAGQGLAALLGDLKGVAELGLKPLPDQFCLWAQPAVFAQSYVAMPVPNATNAARQLSQSLPRFVQARFSPIMGQFAYVSNKAELFWQGLPVAEPRLRPYREGGNDYLLGGLFPVAPGTNAVPSDLFAQLTGRKNLLYYDWEITQERLIHARPLYQLLDILHRRQFTPTNTPSHKWLREVGPLLGNTVTEVTLDAPKQLTLVRKSHLGLTGFELYTLARWVESRGFPLKFEPPPPIELTRTNVVGRSTNAAPRPQR